MFRNWYSYAVDPGFRSGPGDRLFSECLYISLFLPRTYLVIITIQATTFSFLIVFDSFSFSHSVLRCYIILTIEFLVKQTTCKIKYYKVLYIYTKRDYFQFIRRLFSLSQWPRGLRHELSSLARTLGSCVLTCLTAFILCVCCSV
jgi:hypothetical protein